MPIPARFVLALLCGLALAAPPPAGAQIPPAAAQNTGQPAGAQNAGQTAAADFECLLEPKVVVIVGSPVDGVIKEITVERGDPVKAGQVVARLDSGVEAAAVELRRARADFGARKAERNVELYNRKLISAQEKDELDTELKVTEAELKRDIEALKLRTVVSPVNGVVVERFVSPGELVRQDKARILKLAQLDPLNVEVVVPAPLYGTIRPGTAGEVRPAPPVKGLLRATVTVVDPVIDAASGTFGVRLALPNPGGKIPSGIKCRVRFIR